MEPGQDKLKKAVAKAAGVDAGQIKLEHPEAEEFGDYATNIALELKGGRKLAEEIAGKIKRDDVIAEVAVAGPGFINLKLTQTALIDTLRDINIQKDRFGKNKIKAGKKVVVEYTDPNPFKELHIGHLISNVVGESFCRLMEASGANVRRVDYFGDVGIHAAKSVWGLMKQMEKDKIGISDLAGRDLNERVEYMGQAYALGSQRYDEEAVKAEIDRLNLVLYKAAQKMWQEQGIDPVVNYDPEGKIAGSEVEAVYEIYRQGRKWSLDYFETIYAKLGTKFDGYYPESRMGEIGYRYVTDNIGRVFEKSDGAVVFKGDEKQGLHTRVFINKHNLPTYEAKELGLAPAKYQDFAYDESIIVVGTEIKEYFKVLVAALTAVNPKLGQVTRPICTGMVKMPGGKMSSRFGNVVTVLGLIEKLKEVVRIRMNDKGELAEEEKERVLEAEALAAVRYAFLRVGVGQDIVFDLEKSVSLEGNSGPYLQYTYARTQSVLRKAGRQEEGAGERAEPNEEEQRVLRWLYRYPEVIEEATMRLAPNLVCNYLYELAQRFNGFYNKHSILGRVGNTPSDPPLNSSFQFASNAVRGGGMGKSNGETSKFRLALTAAVGQVLKNGLNILGIAAPERM